MLLKGSLEEGVGFLFGGQSMCLERLDVFYLMIARLDVNAN